MSAGYSNWRQHLKNSSNISLSILCLSFMNVCACDWFLSCPILVPMNHFLISANSIAQPGIRNQERNRKIIYRKTVKVNFSNIFPKLRKCFDINLSIAHEISSEACAGRFLLCLNNILKVHSQCWTKSGMKTEEAKTQISN